VIRVLVIRRPGGLLLVAALFVAAFVGGCTGRTTAPGAPAPTPVAGCVSTDEQRAGGLRLPAGRGVSVEGVLIGGGDTGVVLANQVNDDLCQWKPYADELVRLGYRVAVFNYSGQNPTEDVRIVADAVRQKGVRRLFLVGASLGGTAVLDAAARVQPPVAGVVGISAPENFQGADAYGAVRALTVPVLFVAARYDEEYARYAQALYDACTSKDKNISIEPGGNHGTALLSDHVTGLIAAFLKSH